MPLSPRRKPSGAAPVPDGSKRISEADASSRDWVQHVLDGFLPAMEQIQALQVGDDEKKRLAKDWLRSKLYAVVNELEKKRERDRGSCESTRR